MVVKKQKNYMDAYDLILEENDKKLIITFQGNLDLYWILLSSSEKENIDFTITKENYVIYSAFEKLYNDIKDCQVFKEKLPDEFMDEEEALKIEKENEFANHHNEALKQYRNFEDEPLFNDGMIKWHCDNEPYDKANVLTIAKQDDDSFLVNMACNCKSFFGVPSVRIRNNGSRYNPYNIVFMRMFNELQEYNPEYHQTHIEELMSPKKKVLKKDTN